MSIGEAQEYWDTVFEGEDFSGLEISAKVFESCRFIGCNFSDATLKRCSFTDCEFSKCNLSVVNLGYSKFSDVLFLDSKLLGMDWEKAAWSDLTLDAPIKFYRSVISESTFYGLSLQGVVIEDCVAHNVDFREGDFSHADFSQTDFDGAMFSETNLSGVDFSKATGFDIDIFRNKLTKAKFDRFEATRLLASLDIELTD